MSHVARIFQDQGNEYFVCDDDSSDLDARGTPHNTKFQAIRAAAQQGYTHAVGSGTWWRGIRRIPTRMRENSDV
jgi:hypothetical protein